MPESAGEDPTEPESTVGGSGQADTDSEAGGAPSADAPTDQQEGGERPVPPAFELPNAGPGPDPLSLAAIDAAVDFAILLLLRDYHCPKCRAQVQRVAEKAETIDRGDAAVVAILPDSLEKAAAWQEAYDLPFPLLADPGAAVTDEYDQPTGFGAFGRLHDVIGRMPKAVVLDLRGQAEVAYSYDGSTPGDRPEIEVLFDEVDDLQDGFVFDCDLVDC